MTLISISGLPQELREIMRVVKLALSIFLEFLKPLYAFGFHQSNERSVGHSPMIWVRQGKRKKVIWPQTYSQLLIFSQFGTLELAANLTRKGAGPKQYHTFVEFWREGV